MNDFDLDDFETVGPSEEGRWVTIKNLKTNEDSKSKSGTVRRVKVCGPDSRRYRQAMLDTINDRIADDAPAMQQQDHAIENSLRVMAKCTLDWQGIEDRNGEPIQMTEEAAADLYRRFPAIRGQIDAFITSRRNFMVASPQD